MELEAAIICKGLARDKDGFANITKGFISRKNVHKFPATLSGWFLVVALRKVKRPPLSFEINVTDESWRTLFRATRVIKSVPADPIGRFIDVIDLAPVKIEKPGLYEISLYSGLTAFLVTSFRLVQK